MADTKSSQKTSPATSGEPDSRDKQVLRVKIMEAKNLTVETEGKVSVCCFSFGGESFETNPGSFGSGSSQDREGKPTCASWANEEFAFEIGASQLGIEATFSLYAATKQHDEEKGVLVGRHSLARLGDWLEGGGWGGNGREEWLTLQDERGKESGMILVWFWGGSLEEVEASFWSKVVKIVKEQKPYDLNLIEVKMLLEGLGMPLGDEEIEQLFGESDLDQDGLLSAEDLNRAFRGKLALMADSRITHHQSQHGSKGHSLHAKAFCEVVRGDGIQEGDAFTVGGFTAEAKGTCKFRERLANRELLARCSISDTGRYPVRERGTGKIVEVDLPGFDRMGIRILYQRHNFDERELKAFENTLKVITHKQGRLYMDPASAQNILPFIKAHRIDMSEFEGTPDSFKNFNEFFTRRLKPGVRPLSSPDDPRVAVSPADCRCVLYDNVPLTRQFYIKAEEFSIASLLADEKMAEKFNNCSIGVFRLTALNYHHFHHPVDGEIVSSKMIAGDYFTIHPMGLDSHIDVFLKNHRHVCVVNSKEFGLVAFIAIGANLVGSIEIMDKVGQQVRRGDEHGYFAFGGSAVVLLFQQGRIQFDEEIKEWSQKGLETIAHVKTAVGFATKKA